MSPCVEVNEIQMSGICKGLVVFFAGVFCLFGFVLSFFLAMTRQ